MKLFLASEMKHPDSIKRLDGFVGGFQNKKIVYIPTAANGEFFGSWKGGESIQVAQSLGAQFSVVELESIAYTNVLKQIGKPDILWVAGGMSGYLLYWMRRTKLDQVLPELLQKTVYVGSSSGAMICAQTQFSAEWYLGEPEPGASLVPGLGLVPFEIYPHFEDQQREKIESLWEGGELYLLKNGEALTVLDGRVTVLGKERIIRK